MTTLIIGGGFLGTELVQQATAGGQTVVATYATNRGDAPGVAWHSLDLRDAEAVENQMETLRPRLVINTASGKEDWAATAQGPIRLAAAAAKYGSRLLHMSSDAVFSGARVTYEETCLPDLFTSYGAAKAVAEAGVLLVNPEATVVRTSLIIGHGRSAHEHSVYELIAGTRDGVLFTDDVRCPVHVSDLAAAVLELAADDEVSGVQHVAGPDALSRHELGVLIADRDGLDASQLPAGPRGDRVPAGPCDIRLDTRATRGCLTTRLRGAREFLART